MIIFSRHLVQFTQIVFGHKAMWNQVCEEAENGYKPLLNTCNTQNIMPSLNKIELGQSDHASHENKFRKDIKLR